MAAYILNVGSRWEVNGQLHFLAALSPGKEPLGIDWVGGSPGGPHRNVSWNCRDCSHCYAMPRDKHADLTARVRGRSWNSKVHYRLHKSPLPDSMLNQLNSVHAHRPVFI
jgi:hypothetical protein